MNTEMKHNYYEILEVPQTATQQEIALAYEKAKRTYSIQNPALYAIFDKTEAEQLLNMIDEAYAVLANNTYRNIYEKRRQANTFAESELSIESIKAASIELFNETKAKAEQAEAEEKLKATYTPDPIMEEQIANQKVWTAEFLKEVREYKKVSIELLHEKTKINPWYLTALESMDVNNLPAPVFVRGYIVQVARFLNLDDKVVADSYMKIYRKKIEN